MMLTYSVWIKRVMWDTCQFPINAKFTHRTHPNPEQPHQLQLKWELCLIGILKKERKLQISTAV
jgi:hypothetical protein